jgi:Protein of unknown function (DUF3800)
VVCHGQFGNERLFVHLAYLDETGTHDHSPIVMFGALIVPVGSFGYLSGLHSAAIQQILPVDAIETFTEFHACELYQGAGAFEKIEESKRIGAIQVLLAAVRLQELPFIYAAVDRKKFASSPFSTMNPLHTAFHMCLLGIEDWATAHHPGYPETLGQKVKRLDWSDTYLCILDDCTEKQRKEQLRKTYRTLRRKHPFVLPSENRLWHAHDDMFFADSKDCLGIQIADLCNYFVRRRLEGSTDGHQFYDMLAEQITCAKPDPEWGVYRHLLLTHEDT